MVELKLNKKCDLFQQIQQKSGLFSGVIIIMAEPEQFARVHSLFIKNEKKICVDTDKVKCIRIRIEMDV